MILDMVRAGDEEGGKRNWKRWQLRMGRVGLGGARCGGGGVHRSNPTSVWHPW